MNIEKEIRKLQANIIRIKKEKGMLPDYKIINLLLNDKWRQDIIEKIRDNRQK